MISAVEARRSFIGAMLLCILGVSLILIALGPWVLAARNGPARGLEVLGPSDVWIERVEDDDAEVSHQFIIVNRGSQPIRITDIHRSCACMVSQIKQGRVVSPGEEIPIAVTMGVLGKVGTLQEEIHLLTDSPVTPKIQLTLGGVIPPRPQVSYRPQRLFFSSPEETRRLYLVVPKLEGYLKPEFWQRTGWIHAEVEEIESSAKYTQYAIELRVEGVPANREFVEGEFGLRVRIGPDGFLSIPVVFRPVQDSMTRPEKSQQPSNTGNSAEVHHHDEVNQN